MTITRKRLSVLLACCLLLCCVTQAQAAAPTFSDPVAAADHIRAAMVNRQTNVSFFYVAPIARVGEVTAANLTAYYTGQLKQIQDNIFAHTGRGNEGDYLRTHLVASPTGVIGNGDGYFSDDETSLIYPGAYTASFYTTAAQEQRVTDELAVVMRQLNLSGKSDYEKVRAINDFICGRVTYDKAHQHDSSYLLKYSAYAALINGTAVCQGFASLFYRMALEAGVENRIISGEANNGAVTGDHAWNIVRVDGVYYCLDVTWNAESHSDRYFLVGKDGFRDHVPFDEFNTPAFNAAHPLSETACRPGAPASQFRAGDVDGDGSITSGDARLALRASVRLENYPSGSERFRAADIDGNGLIEASDARTILRISVRLEPMP